MPGLTESRNTVSTKKRGRPKGSKNGATLLGEAIKGDFERSLKQNFKSIMKVLIQEAKDGNMVAIKLLMDKVVPNASTEQDKKGIGDMVVNISISDMTPKEVVIEGEQE